MPGLYTVFDRCGTLVDHRHCGQPSTPLNTEKAPSTTTPPDRARQANRRVIDRLIDRLGAQPPRRLPGEEDPELVRDLLGTPALVQQPRDEITQHAVPSNPPLTGFLSAEPGSVLCVMRAISAVSVAVALDLPADRRWRPAQLPSDPTSAPTGSEQISDHDPLLL
jgi:hypothetical protein